MRRAVSYSLLAHCFAYPDEQQVAALQEAAAAAAPFVEGSPVGELIALAVAATSEDLEAEFVRLFALSSSPDCPTFETAYYAAETVLQTNRMADIAGFYRAFGVDSGTAGLRPDEICVELEFMGYLARKELYAREHLGAPRVGQVVKAERMFLSDHLGTWGTTFGRRVSARAGLCAFYREAGFALSSWVVAECNRTGAKPAAIVEGPVAGWDAEVPDPADREEQVFDPDEIPVT